MYVVVMDDLLLARMPLDCVCLGLRRASRLVTRHYEAHLRTEDLTAGQFSVLAAMAAGQDLRTTIADALGMDRSTLSRTVQPLIDRGLVATSVGTTDRRIRRLVLTPTGLEVLARAIPLWQRAQAERARLLAPLHWDDVRAALSRLEQPA